MTLEEVLSSGEVAYPLTRMMCSPVRHGAAAAVLCPRKVAGRFTNRPVWVHASVIGIGKISYELEYTLTMRVGARAFEAGSIGPEDLDVLEVHDATSPSEIITLIELGICPGEEAPKWIEEWALEIGGRMPTNPSGGLQSKGHPIGATGLGQIYEVVQQLRGRAGNRQVEGARVGLTQNGGGILGVDGAAMAFHILKR